MSTSQDIERTVEFEFVRATENAALNAIHWLGRGNKEAADQAACDAINGVFDLVDIRGEVVIGEGVKDKAPGIFLGDKLGRGREGSPRFDIALDPIDGTTNMSKGLPNSICVMAAAHVPEGKSHGMINIPSFYAEKLTYGPIGDSQLLPGVKFVGNTATTYSILMRARSQTVRYIRAVHNLDSKTIHLRSVKREAKV